MFVAICPSHTHIAKSPFAASFRPILVVADLRLEQHTWLWSWGWDKMGWLECEWIELGLSVICGFKGSELLAELGWEWRLLWDGIPRPQFSACAFCFYLFLHCQWD